MLGLVTYQGTEVGYGVAGGEVVDAVLDEVGALHSGKHELGLLAGQLVLHGAQDGVGLGGCLRRLCEGGGGCAE